MALTVDDEEFHELLSYCQQSTDAQLQEIYCRERDRSKRHPTGSEIGDHSRLFVFAAREELARRGLEVPE